jgi:CRISPR-associated protein Csd1
MLNLLIDYAKTHGLTIEPGFKPKTVRWAIVCDKAGRFLNVQELGNSDDKKNRGQIFSVCPDLSQPEMKAGGSGCRHFLVDNVEVVTLLGKEGDVSGDKKAKAKHDFFVSLLRQGANAMKVLDNLADLLDSEDALSAIQRAFAAKRFKPTYSVTFAITGRVPMFLVEDNAWHDWWRGFRQSLLAGKSAKRRGSSKTVSDQISMNKSMRCFASGGFVEPASTHPKIEGLSDVGGLSMGDVLAGFKQESFCSYFLIQSENAAVSGDMAAAYRGGLNDLIKNHSRRLTSAKVVHWYAGKKEVPNELDPLNWLVDVEDTDTAERDAQNRARSLLDSIRSGERSELLHYRFYSLTLSGASGRVMIRDWIEGQFGELAANIDAWFSDLAIVRRDGDTLAKRPKFLAVLGGLVRELKDIPPPVEAKLWRVAVRKEPIPEFVMAQALSRVKVDVIQDEPMSHARMGLLKAYHIRKGDKNMQPYLNEDHPNPAYHCGRLMAMYADLQYAALGDVGAGVIQRYYASASATPALILGRLSRGSQFHLNKLEGGLAHWYEQRLASIWGRIQDAPPKVLTLEEQSLFALGYYQQKAAPRKSASDNNQQQSNVKEK